MNKEIVFSALLCLLFVPTAFGGSNKLLWCDGCDLNAIKNRAQGAAVGSADTLWVGDITTNTVLQIPVAYVADDPKTCDRDANTCGHFEAFEQPVSGETETLYKLQALP